MTVKSNERGFEGPGKGDSDSKKKKLNKLQYEKSPYLLQHASNPVNWHSWSDEAFEKAAKESKPIFLSIGYSTCHWCHIMEAESFEDEEVSRLLNENFINVKVDREERPDIDKIYMDVCVMMTGSGGWPLTVVTTPDKKPFFAGTYFPRNDKYGKIGLITLLKRISDIWNSRRKEAHDAADKITNLLREFRLKPSGEDAEESVLRAAYHNFERTFDERNGGFGAAPKFPSPHNFLFLLRYWDRTGQEKALEMTKKSLRRMRYGGVYDHLGFGFHRYSTDNEWLVPHFEKMLYDQAMMTMAFTNAYRTAHDDFFRKTSEEILTYVLRDMTSLEGAFYSAEDADSEGREGEFYLWTEDELKRILDDDEFHIAATHYNCSAQGNFTDPFDSSGLQKNILYMKNSKKITAEKLGLSIEEFNGKIEGIRRKLFLEREERIHPHKDDKILADWNGLMIAAFAEAGRVFRKERYIRAAEKAANFIFDNLFDPSGRMLHRYRDGEAAVTAHLDDYSFFIWGLLELYEATFNAEYLGKAIKLMNVSIEDFWDDASGAFYFTSEKEEEFLVRKKEIHDGAVPSGNSVALMNLQKLGRITGNAEFTDKAAITERLYVETLKKAPTSSAQMLTALDYRLGPSFEIVIVGERGEESTEKLIDVVREVGIFRKAVIFKTANDETDEINSLAPFVRSYGSLDGKAAVYVCRDQKCSLPVADPDQLREMLMNPSV